MTRGTENAHAAKPRTQWDRGQLYVPPDPAQLNPSRGTLRAVVVRRVF